MTHALRADGFDASEDGTGRGTPLVPVGFRASGQDGFTPSEICPPITSTDGGGACVPTVVHGTQDPCVGDIAFALQGNQGQENAIAFNLRGREGGAMPEVTDVASLRAASGGSSRTYVGVRRLTPRECERLQGFPDDYTAVNEMADGPRYRALGNSMAVPVMDWIGRRIEEAVKAK